MIARTRHPAAQLALFAFASGILGLLGAHAHAFGEIDRVAHSLIEIDHPALATGAPHFDLARELEHPACGDCLLASLKSSGAADPVVAEAPASPEVVPARAESAAASAPQIRRPPARAPPLV